VTSPATNLAPVTVERWGRLGYGAAVDRMRSLVAQRTDGARGDVVVTVEHDPVYTAGRHADIAAHVLGTRPDIPLVATDRGGDVTYHGPGQAVVYPVLLLADPKAIRPYIGALLDAAVATAAAWGVTARADLDQAGVWVGQSKLAAVGIRVERGVTSHGIAFNVAPDPAHFLGIVPCGLGDAGVCSLASLGVTADLDTVSDHLVAELIPRIERLR
jgi:lipoate-protein ligase B